MIDLVQWVQDTQGFLKLAAIKLRQIAEQAPEIAVELREVAHKTEAETDTEDPASSMLYMSK